MSRSVVEALKQKRTSVIDTPTTGSPKCYACSKTVYKPEEVLALNKVWHNTCFTCGSCSAAEAENGFVTDGCKKKLTRDKYVDHSDRPYCDNCYSKLFKPKGYGYSNTLNTYKDSDNREKTVVEIAANISNIAIAGELSPEESEAPTPPILVFSKNTRVEEQEDINGTKKAPAPTLTTPVSASVPAPNSIIAPVASISKPATKVIGTPSPKCTVCAKSVFKMEELLAIGRVWHTSCFTCGGGKPETLGCKKTLKRDSYLDHDNMPYCNACFSKNFKPKGYGYSNTLNTFSGTSSASSSNNKSAVDNTTDAKKTNTYIPPSAPKSVTQIPIIATPVTAVEVASVPVIAPPSRIILSSAPELNPLPPSAPSFVLNSSSSDPATVSKRRSSLVHQEQSYVGNNDEVDDDEW